MSVTEAVFQPEMSWLNEDAPSNIDDMLVTEAVFQRPIGWLKAALPANIDDMLVTLAVFQPEMSWLKDDLANIDDMLVAATGVQFVRSLVNPEPANASLMLVTFETFQLDRSRLNADASLKIPLMLVTDVTVQLEMSPLNAEAPLKASLKFVVASRSGNVGRRCVEVRRALEVATGVAQRERTPGADVRELQTITRTVEPPAINPSRDRHVLGASRRIRVGGIWVSRAGDLNCWAVAP